MPEIVKQNKIVRLPNHSTSVEGTFNYAMCKAKEQGRTRVIISGENATSGRGKTIKSRMAVNTAIAMIAKIQHVLLRDSCDGE